jgi:hypothetical protein
MTISDELETLIQTKKNIKAAITNKGVSIPSGTPFASYPDAINAISGEGGSFVDLSNYVTKDELEGYATEDYVKDAIKDIEISGGDVDLTGYATEEYVQNVIGDINTVLDVINGEIIPDDTEEVNTLLDDINGEVI